MSTVRSGLCRSLLLTVLLAASGCNKLEKAFGDPPGAHLPDAPFSLECQLRRSLVGDRSLEPGDSPAWMRIQLNPKGEFYKIVEHGGSLPDYQRIYTDTDWYRDYKGDKRVPTFEQGGDIPFVGVSYEGTKQFRTGASNPGVVILAEHNDVWFRDGPLGSDAYKGRAYPYMDLDVKERTLNIRYEWRGNAKTYAEYQQHPRFLGGPASFKFSCARSPKDTVIEVDGFDQ